MNRASETAILAGGCFWGMQDLLRRYSGVISTRVGYVLEVFFQIHDPTTPYRQGNDQGASYRSAIFYLNEEQRQIAEKTISDIEASGIWPGNIPEEMLLTRPIATMAPTRKPLRSSSILKS
jgi:peptide-methionine (S)-S-oxide reductase